MLPSRLAKRAASRGTRLVRSASVIAVVLAAIELLSILTSGYAPVSHLGMAGSTAGADGDIAASLLAAAESTLRSGAGPAAGTPTACSDAAGLGASVECSAIPSGGFAEPPPVAGPPWSHEQFPSARGLGTMTYDARDKCVLLFGGQGNSGNLNDTWEYAGGLWKQLQPSTSPSGRYGGSMAFDGADNYVVLYGGVNGSVALSDTWKFSAGSWTELEPTTNPGALILGTMSYDAKDGYIVYFGGETETGVAKGLTWEFKGGQWTQLKPTAHPSPRFDAAMDYDAADGYVVLFGGINSMPAIVGDTWSFSGGQWTKLTVTPHPSARYEAALAYSAKDGELILFGGYAAGGAVSDTWTFVAGVWTKISERTHPSSRLDMQVADGTSTTGVFVFGGVNGDGDLQSDLWTFAGLVWSNVIPKAPTLRQFASMTYDEADGYVLLFGGTKSGFSSGALGDTWKFAHGLWTELSPARSPSPRSGAAMTYDAADGYVLLFGGSNAQGNDLNDTWTFLAGKWTELVPKSEVPPARAMASMTFDDADGYVLMFGGANSTAIGGYQGDCWAFSGGVWSEMSTGPSPRAGAQMAYDSEDGYVVLFGGLYDNGELTLNDTWTYLGGSWTNISSSLAWTPDGRYGAGFVDDTYDGYLVLFSGTTQSGVFEIDDVDTEAFEDGAWVPLAPAVSPYAEGGIGMAFYPPGNEVVLLDVLYPPTYTWTY
jgi:hypothetical protein